MKEEQQTGLAIFEGKTIRRTWHNDEWWFAVADIVEFLSESKDVRQYIKKMRSRDPELGDKWGTICTPLPMEAADGRTRRINASNLEGMFRIIQSISSPKAEPFKQWLAKVGKQRIDELENPELAIDRMREDYRAMGYPDDWIVKRLQSIDIRKTLTEEWDKRGVEKGLEYSILTAEIAQNTFGLKPSDHKALKKLERENLRDHMSDLELIFTMLGEAGTRKQAIDKDAFGFHENRDAAREGGTAAGKAREAFELESGQKVVSAKNRKDQIKAAKAAKRLETKKRKKKD
jgi:hypothetical protein